jgi:hypothetical protein
MINTEFTNRLIFFQNQVKERFSFLKDYGYSLDKIEDGQSEKFKDYFSEFTFTNEDTVIKISFSTDIINGRRAAFPNRKENELPIVDSQILCTIWDKNAFMAVNSYIEEKFPEISLDDFKISIDSPDLELEISRVTNNYSEFFITSLTLVLEKKLIYNCYTDWHYAKVFEEIHYR